MTYLIGSSSTSSYVNTTSYNDTQFYSWVNGNDTQGIPANFSGTATVLNLYISSWVSSNIKACLYEDNILLNSVIIPNSVGTGLISVAFPSTTITSGTQRYRLAFYLDAVGGINLFTIPSALTQRKVSSGTYTTPATTLPAGAFVGTAEYYWALQTAPSYVIDTLTTPIVLGVNGQVTSTSLVTNSITSITAGLHTIAVTSGIFSTALVDGQTSFALGAQNFTATNGVNTSANFVGTVTLPSTQQSVVLTSVDSGVGGIAFYGATPAIGDTVIYSSPASLSVDVNEVTSEGIVRTDFTGTQSIYLRSASTGIVTVISWITGSSDVPTNKGSYCIGLGLGVGF